MAQKGCLLCHAARVHSEVQALLGGGSKHGLCSSAVAPIASDCDAIMQVFAVLENIWPAAAQPLISERFDFKVRAPAARVAIPVAVPIAGWWTCRP